MADLAIVHHTVADGTFSATGDTEWERVHDFTGILPVANGGTGVDGSTLTSGRVALIGASGVITDDAGLTYNATTDRLTVTGIIEGARGLFNTQASTTVPSVVVDVGVNGSMGIGYYHGVGGMGFMDQGFTRAWVNGVNGEFGVYNSGKYWFGSTTSPANNFDTGFGRGGANQVIHGGASVSGGSATSRAEINKAVTAFTDGVAKTVFTLTIPNAAHSASYLVRITGTIGAGGAIGANEASATNCYVVTLTRTAGVNAVAGISAAFGASAANVAGGTTVTCTAALAAVAGGVGASNTIDIQATITKGGGASDNHTCVATASLLNANASGVTIS